VCRPSACSRRVLGLKVFGTEGIGTEGFGTEAVCSLPASSLVPPISSTPTLTTAACFRVFTIDTATIANPYIAGTAVLGVVSLQSLEPENLVTISFRLVAKCLLHRAGFPTGNFFIRQMPGASRAIDPAFEIAVSGLIRRSQA